MFGRQIIWRGGKAWARYVEWPDNGHSFRALEDWHELPAEYVVPPGIEIFTRGSWESTEGGERMSTTEEEPQTEGGDEESGEESGEGERQMVETETTRTVETTEQ